jgi:dihydroflavonol-4-reductase
MKRALVTGAPGFVGAHIAAQLVDRGVAVRGLARPGEDLTNLAGLAVEVVHGDVRDPEAMRRAVEGMDTVFHAAAIYEAYSRDPGRMYDVNLRGTFHVLEACRRAGVDKVIYTASIAALGRPAEGRIADETAEYEAWDLDFAYSRSKYLSKRTAEDFAAWGLDVRIVCPGIVFGPGDRVPTPSGRLILSLAAGEAPGYTAGGASYVDVRDAAAGHLAAADRGAAGESYIVTGHNLSNRDFLHVVCRVAGLRRRSLKIPTPVASAYVRLREKLAVRRGETPALASAFFEYGARNCFYDNAKAVRQLGVKFRPIEETVRDALAWFRAEGVAGN